MVEGFEPGPPATTSLLFVITHAGDKLFSFFFYIGFSNIGFLSETKKTGKNLFFLFGNPILYFCRGISLLSNCSRVFFPFINSQEEKKLFFALKKTPQGRGTGENNDNLLIIDLFYATKVVGCHWPRVDTITVKKKAMTNVAANVAGREAK